MSCTGGAPSAPEPADAASEPADVLRESATTPADAAPEAAKGEVTDGAQPGPKTPSTTDGAAPEDLVDWVRLDGGSFEMRSDIDDAAHFTEVTAFEIAKTEVTQAQYHACVDAGACPAADPADCADDEAQKAKLVDPGLPMVCVDWAQARAFSRWVGGDLPSEAQWAWAARSGGKDRAFVWGDQTATCVRAVMNWGCAAGFEGAVMQPPCSKPKGNSDQGVCDLAGNVAEWMGEVAAFDEDTRSRGTKINRGGSWHGMDGPFHKNGPEQPSGLRTAHRSRYAASMKSNDLGFRPARPVGQ